MFFLYNLRFAADNYLTRKHSSSVCAFDLRRQRERKRLFFLRLGEEMCIKSGKVSLYMTFNYYGGEKYVGQLPFVMRSSSTNWKVVDGWSCFFKACLSKKTVHQLNRFNAKRHTKVCG